MKRVILLILALVLTLSLMACRSKEPEAADAADNNTLSNSAPLTFAEASALEYDNGQVTCRFRRDEDGWKWVDDEEFPLDASYVEEILTALDGGEYGQIVRAKGIVPNGEGKWLHFDYVPEEHEIRAGHPDYTGRLCVIGAELKEDKLAELFGL